MRNLSCADCTRMQEEFPEIYGIPRNVWISRVKICPVTHEHPLRFLLLIWFIHVSQHFLEHNIAKHILNHFDLHKNWL